MVDRVPVASVESLRQIEGFATADLADEVRSAGGAASPATSANGHSRQAGLFAARFKPNEVDCFQLEFGGVLDEHEPVISGRKATRALSSVVCHAGAAADQNIVASVDGCLKGFELREGQRANADELLRSEVPALKLADCQRSATKADWRERGGDARSIGQPRIEQRLFLRDVVAENSSKVPHGHAQVVLAQFDTVYPGDPAFALNKDPA
jgi:hypothetical protein